MEPATLDQQHSALRVRGEIEKLKNEKLWTAAVDYYY